MKNVLAVIGFAVVLKKGYDLYCEYARMKSELEACKAASAS